MRKILLLVLVVLVFTITSAAAQDEQDKIINEQYDTAEVDQLTGIADHLIDAETKQVIPDFNVEKLTKDLSTGKMEFNMEYFMKKVISFFMKEVYLNVRIMLQLIVLAIICGILTNLQSSFNRDGVGEVAFFACYIFLIGVMIKSFSYAVGIGRDVIDNMVMFMQSMVPTLMTLLISTGNITSASIFQPAILFSVQIIGTVIKNMLIPILFFATALSMVNNVSDKFHVTKLVDFLNQLAKWSLGILLTGFIGVITVQGFASSVIDGVGSKTAKFAVGNFIPVVGGILSDAVDTVIGCSLILKNAIGIAGLVVIILICFVPVIKIAALMVIYRLTGAVIEPVSDKRIVQCISDLGNSLTLIFAMVISVAVMFLLSITIVVGASNISAMMR
ncbi:stage III sporulation protein AE [Petroclostridium sp. X23]|uniref:stage III sporulation protein AE n=1 Tax=Petroclostridium sp. X23 TaxID=3045146 RepID=UPI0024AE86DA|nr:stage III sporulation protein AE [Petroclostridium sp. X23]WHH59643.1 stage III sporulation protein AE [Petroclostridium sp. X23]